MITLFVGKKYCGKSSVNSESIDWLVGTERTIQKTIHCTNTAREIDGVQLVRSVCRFIYICKIHMGTIPFDRC